MAATRYSRLERAGRALERFSAWPGRVAGWLIIPITLAVLSAVIGSLLRLGDLVSWETPLPLLGNKVSITGLAELQWHLFGVMVMLGGAYALTEDRHVRVDFIYERLPVRWRRTIDALGDLIFLLPAAAIIAWLSIGFVEMSYRSGEQSDYGGLTHRYLIKAILPIGLGILFLAGLARIMRNVGSLLSGSADPETGDTGREHHG